MGELNNTRNLKINDLEKSGLYDKQLLNELRIGDFTSLSELPLDVRADIEYMEPLLYAVKNELDTFKVYKYYAESLQNDIRLASEIIKTEPDLIEGTPISRNEQFIKENARSKPQIIKYMDPQLKTNEQFISELKSEKNSQIDTEIASIGIAAQILNNPQLGNDKEFMSNAIRNDATFLEYASKELRNDSEFLRNESLQNEDIIKYVVDNTEKFGLKGIEGVRESSTEYILSNEEYLETIDNKSKEENKYKNAKEKMEEHINNGNKGTAVLIMSALTAQNDNVNEEFVTRNINYATLTMETFKQDLSESGEMKLDSEHVKQLITPVVLDKLLKKLEEQGISLNKETEQKIDNYKEFYNDYMGKVREKRREEHPQKISISNVQEVTEDAVPDENITRLNEKGEKVKEDMTL